MDVSPAWWFAVVGVILGMLAIDLLVFHRDAHEVSTREAAAWTLVWIALGLGFGAVVAWRFGLEPGTQYLTGYVIEKSLAVDNIFVFAVIFSAFSIPARYQHRVLFWGVIGALVLRALFIAAGIALIEQFHWMIFLLGALLVVTAWRLLTRRGHHPDPSENRAIRWMRRRVRMTDRLDGQRFLTVVDGKRVATPLLAALVAVEVADVVFAVDSIPAVLAVTSDPFLVFSSNAFAILGLRSMYFLLANMLERLELLSVGLAVVLAFVGFKMMLSDVYEIPIVLSLGVIVVVLAISVLASLHRSARRRTTAEVPPQS